MVGTMGLRPIRVGIRSDAPAHTGERIGNVPNGIGDIMLKMLRALRRMEPVEKGTSFVAHTRDGENGEPIEIDRDTVLWGLSRLEPWPAPIFVNVYELDQSYGGPEEGGWWVSTQTPVASEQMVGTADVWEALVRLSERFSRNVANHQGVSSVLYNGGEYSFALENHEGEFYPSDPEAWHYA